MIISDWNQAATDGNYAVKELNFNPAIHIHCHPLTGKNRRLNEKLLDLLGFPVIVESHKSSCSGICLKLKCCELIENQR